MPDPMPKWVQPMLAKLSSSLPKDDERWAYEMKWDGIRGLAFIERGKLRIMTRNQLEVTTRYPELAGLGAAFNGRNTIFDGEIVGFDDEGRPRFEALQQRMGLEGGHRIPARPDVAVAYMIFDVLHLDDRSLLTSPFSGGDVPRETRFVEPRLVDEVEFTEWTSRTAQLRHPSFKGLRWDKAAADVVREDA